MAEASTKVGRLFRASRVFLGAWGKRERERERNVAFDKFFASYLGKEFISGGRKKGRDTIFISAFSSSVPYYYFKLIFSPPPCFFLPLSACSFLFEAPAALSTYKVAHKTSVASFLSLKHICCWTEEVIDIAASFYAILVYVIAIYAFHNVMQWNNLLKVFI